MKRLLALLLCLVMALSLIPAAAAEDIEIVEIEPVGAGALDDPSDEELIEIVDPEANVQPNGDGTTTYRALLVAQTYPNCPTLKRLYGTKNDADCLADCLSRFDGTYLYEPEAENRRRHDHLSRAADRADV